MTLMKKLTESIELGIKKSPLGQAASDLDKRNHRCVIGEFKKAMSNSESDITTADYKDGNR